MAESKVKDDIYEILAEAEQAADSARRGTIAAGGSELQAQIDGLQVLIAEVGAAMYVVADALGTLMPDPVVRPAVRRPFGDWFLRQRDG